MTASCVCGSDLHPYRGNATRGLPRRIGHEFIGVVTDAGSAVTTVKPGDLVVAPFAISDGTLVRVDPSAGQDLVPDMLPCPTSWEPATTPPSQPDVAEGYRAMDERRAIKALLRP